MHHAGLRKIDKRIVQYYNMKATYVTDLSFSNVIYNLEIHVGSMLIKQRKGFFFHWSSVDDINFLFQLCYVSKIVVTKNSLVASYIIRINTWVV